MFSLLLGYVSTLYSSIVLVLVLALVLVSVSVLVLVVVLALALALALVFVLVLALAPAPPSETRLRKGARWACLRTAERWFLKLTKGVLLKGVIQTLFFGKPWFIGCP